MISSKTELSIVYTTLCSVPVLKIKLELMFRKKEKSPI